MSPAGHIEVKYSMQLAWEQFGRQMIRASTQIWRQREESALTLNPEKEWQKLGDKKSEYNGSHSKLPEWREFSEEQAVINLKYHNKVQYEKA